MTDFVPKEPKPWKIFQFWAFRLGIICNAMYFGFDNDKALSLLVPIIGVKPYANLLAILYAICTICYALSINKSSKLAVEIKLAFQRWLVDKKREDGIQ